MVKITSPGKLLLTSEYVVLDGALALAVPTKLGQECFFSKQEDGKSLIRWEAFNEEKHWLSVLVDFKKWEILETNNKEAACFVLKTLQCLQNLSQNCFKENYSYQIRTNLQFPSNFGLGSSSTLINNLAEWTKVNPFELNDLILGGSGYDIAVAKEKSPLLFQKFPNHIHTQKLDYNPNFKEELIFIHLNKKQDSREGIRLYKSSVKTQEQIDFFTDITHKVIQTTDVETFDELMTIHETELSKITHLKTAKDTYFKDCPVFVKSLGAWGGDFVMSRKFDGYETYFTERGFPVFFSWQELISG